MPSSLVEIAVSASFRIWRWGALAVALGFLAFWFVREVANGPHADPGGRILNQLRTAAQALPADAQVTYRNDLEPKWDSCDGRSGTFGWDDVVVQIHFQSRTGTATLVDHADRTFRSLGWNSDYHDAVKGDPQVGWSRSLDNGSMAKAQLTANVPNPTGVDRVWDLFVSAPPVGTRVSGC